MIKNNLKVVKSDSKKEQELKEKNKSLEAAISQIDQNFGKGSVMKLGQQQALDIESVSTGSLSLDLALRYRRIAKRQNYRSLWARIIRENNFSSSSIS